MEAFVFTGEAGNNVLVICDSVDAAGDVGDDVVVDAAGDVGAGAGDLTNAAGAGDVTNVAALLDVDFAAGCIPARQ